jgi:uncharacterized protein (DUF4415 family)
MKRGTSARSTLPKRRPRGRAAEGADLVAAEEWNDPEYGDAARERNPIYRQMHGLPPLRGDEPVEAGPEEQRLTLRLDADLIDLYRAEAKRLGARRPQDLMRLVLRGWMERRRERGHSERRAAE